MSDDYRKIEKVDGASTVDIKLREQEINNDYEPSKQKERNDIFKKQLDEKMRILKEKELGKDFRKTVIDMDHNSEIDEMLNSNNEEKKNTTLEDQLNMMGGYKKL